ncbi:MAG: hypothetical protein IT285_10365, partial [Bdellovibrionales bacterium]|nr:hypothetical protein [Bdellovibrionales bacterium]
MSPGSELSIVVPVGPGDSAWQSLLPELAVLAPDAELILAGAEARPSSLPATVLWVQSERGRARQLNAGARVASRPYLWFLHADTQLPG